MHDAGATECACACHAHAGTMPEAPAADAAPAEGTM